jgi:hypothetical protein
MNTWSSGDDPILPYDGTSGWTGSESSEDRARSADDTGVTSRRQRETLNALFQAGTRGLTWKELAEGLAVHHGVASSALSVLHKTGHISRLAETRARCKVYVHPQFVNERPVERHGRTAATGLLARAIGVLRDQGECPFHRLAYPEPDCLGCRGAEVVAEYDRRG